MGDKVMHRVTSEEYRRLDTLSVIVPEKVFAYGMTVERGKRSDGKIDLFFGPWQKEIHRRACSRTLDQSGRLSPLTCVGFRWPNKVKLLGIGEEDARELIEAFFGASELQLRFDPVQIVGNPYPWLGGSIVLPRVKPEVEPIDDAALRREARKH